MNCHQILTGAVNTGDNCYSVGSVEGVSFTAYTAGCNIVILAGDFNRVQIIPGILHGNVQVNCLDAATDVGKIAAAYGKRICIFEPTPLLHKKSNHKLDYKWIQTASFEADCNVVVLSWNLEGTKLLSGGTFVQLWHLITISSEDEDGKVNKINENTELELEEVHWDCVWQCKTASPVTFLKFSPDGLLFTSAGKADRLVKIWFESAAKTNYFGQTSTANHEQDSHLVSYSFIYVAHPRAITGLSWRKTSKYIPRSAVANMLVTSCRDNICRLWVQTLLPDDGLVNFNQIEGLANHVTPKSQTHRHRQKLMQRLKHMKSFSQFKKRQAVMIDETQNKNEPIPNLPSTYSVHDFHSFGIHGMAMAPGLHFHLAASINAETDIPLVPSLSGLNIDAKEKPNFVIHWLNNKEMTYTQSAENLLHEISVKIIQAESAPSAQSDGSDTGEDAEGETDETDGASTITAESLRKRKTASHRKGGKHFTKNHSLEETEEDIQQPSRQSFHTTSSSASLAADATAATSQANHNALGDFLDRKLENLLRQWHTSPDLLFSLHPVDGSLLVWLVEWLDETNPGSFRQAQVSFSSRIPNAIPLGDAATMSHNIALYSPVSCLNLRSAFTSSDDATEKIVKEESNSLPTPTVCMLTKHNNGTLNLWDLGFGENSNYTQVLSISHHARACGHRFRVNDVTCHPVLPLLLTTSHHNVPGCSLNTSKSPESSFTNSPTATPTSSSCCPQELPYTGFCSELILWKVEPVGPLSKSGGVVELARINSPETSAFANVAWIPTLLPSTTLGSISNSPSACFVASDGHQLRIYQAVIDARALLAEVNLAQKRNMESDVSASGGSTPSETMLYRHCIQEVFRVVSLQSTARPGCILELSAITDADHDWQNTQLLHVFQEQLIRGDNKEAYTEWSSKQEKGAASLLEPSLGAFVDLRHSATFEEPFYLIVIEKNGKGQSVLHMWRLVISSHFHDDASKLSYVPDTNLVQEDSDHSNRSSLSNSPELKFDDKNQAKSHISPLHISTTKVYSQILFLDADVEVIHAAPAAGHLSSSNIYPACFAPYLICTACTDGIVRFWCCKMKDEENSNEESQLQPLSYEWEEWDMMLSSGKSSAIEVPGLPLFVSCAYTGRISCAYKHGPSYSRMASKNPSAKFININLAIYECESTGGSEWILEDTIHLKNVAIPHTELNLGIELAPLVDTSLRNRKTADTLITKIAGNEEHTEHRGTTNIQRLLSVPSYTTMQSLKRIISEQGNQFTFAQKSLVQLDWVSTEDGSHVLTVSVGSKISLFTPVSTDIAQANMQALKASEKAGNSVVNRMLLKQASSMATTLVNPDDLRWMNLRTTQLATADGLPPLPMQMAWVRDGILVVGMDNEMHIYTQWKNNKLINDDVTEVTDSRVLTEQGLLIHAQESSQLRLPTHPGSLPRSPSSSHLVTSSTGISAETKKVQPPAQQKTFADTKITLSQLPDFGIFEASRLACPVLPQYHPKKLMELLSFGKIQRVRAILGHLVNCLYSLSSLKNCVNIDSQSLERRSESERSPRSWLRTRTLSVAATASSPSHQVSPLDPEGMPLVTEELELDYTEITSIRPMPLFSLIEADNEKSNVEKGNIEDELDYDNLFDSAFKTQVEETLDEILDKSAFTYSPKMKKAPSTEKISATNFGPKQARVLSKLLTHSHLPGLSSLDQMHLLALADSVASFNPSGRNMETTGLNGEVITMDSLDDCGLRFLLTMRQHIYLLRCLPLVQRKTLEKEGLGTQNLIWAFHSETQEELVQLIPSVQKGNPKWNELKELGVGYWVRNNNLLRKLIERVAKASFQQKNDPLDAALYYLAMKKKSLVWGLFRSVQDRRMTDFFANNFNESRHRKAALKNAYVLLGKQRFEHAAAFFLLAGSVKDAVDICLHKLDDLQLAIIVVRLYEGDIETVPPNLKRLFYENVLGCKPDGTDYSSSQAHPDPFLRSMAYWILQDYNIALSTLLETNVGASHSKANADLKTSELNVSPSVFNFYLYLRNQPLIVRRQFAQAVKENKEKKPALIHDPKTNISDAITPFERRLFFLTAHAHFRAGCPSLALEVLSRLPNRIVLDDQKDSRKQSIDEIKTEIYQSATNGDKANSIDWGAESTAGTNETLEFDWGAPVSSLEPVDTTFQCEINVEKCSDDDSSLENGIEITANEKEIEEKNANQQIKLDIMAQQLKFIACLKILMEELSTLATGFEVDGGQLRYQLYIWLEKSVQALKTICNYRTFSMRHIAGESYGFAEVSGERGEAGSAAADRTPRGSHSDGSGPENKPTLHEILLADKMDFEAKLDRASKRKIWLTSNEALLRTLLSYCSLHGAHGGGLSSVRMELILLLQELQQERSQQQLLSPLPFPTSLPLLAASVACQKTVIADPIRHLQSMSLDILTQIVEINAPLLSLSPNYSLVNVLRDLGISLSACIYQSLCDSDNIVPKQGSMKNDMSSSVVFQNSHLLAGHQTLKRNLSSSTEVNNEILNPITPPNKWPGVQSLRALLARDKDEDSPKLHTLLCEIYVSVYLSQLLYALAACDSHVLYRLISHEFDESSWSSLFGGGAKKLIHVTTATIPMTAASNPSASSEEIPTSKQESLSLDLFNTLSKQRMKLHMKILQQLNQNEKPVASTPNIKEDRPTYREQFVPPQMSVISYLMSKPKLPDEYATLDYDSSESVLSEEDDDGGVDVVTADSVFGEGLLEEETEKIDTEQYAWGLMRFAVMRLARQHLFDFLIIAGIEFQDIPTSSPLVHSIFKVMDLWLKYLNNHMENFNGPPLHFLPNTFVETGRQGGPAILKYKSLLEQTNTPFHHHNAITKASKRLWNYLVRQEKVQDIFIRYIFGKPKSEKLYVQSIANLDDENSDSTNPEPMRIIHKDQDNISSFCINRANSGLIAIATPKEIQELDMSALLEPVPWLEEEAEYDIINLLRSPESLPSTDYLVVQHPADRIQTSPGGIAIQSAAASIHPVNTGKSSITLKRHKTEGTKRMSSHPTLPIYVSGSQDGSVCLWEWNHSQFISSPRPSGTFAKVTRVGFNQQGNKVGVTDGDGILSLWQVAASSSGSTPFFSQKCHSKQANDFTFLGSSSLVLTVGESLDHKNVALWDTLLPSKKCLVTNFACHEQHGASSVLYAPLNQLLITGGRKGDVFIFDLRQRTQRNKFQAHESAIKCMTLDPGEEFFVTGSADGDIKVWGLSSVHILFYSFPGEHSRSTLFRNIGMGVSHLYVDQNGQLYSCGADGSMKMRQLPDRVPNNNIVNTF